MKQALYNDALCDFLSVATTPFHATKRLVQMFEEAGFIRLSDGAAWDTQPGGRYFVTRNDSAIVAFVRGKNTPWNEGVRMVGAHTDSPCLMVKPSPEIRKNGFLQLGVEVYGGALLNPWFDRDLSLAGRVSYTDNDNVLRTALVDFREPIAIIPSLAIHLDRTANSERTVNAQTDIPPILCAPGGKNDATLRELLKSHLEKTANPLAVKEVLDYELSFYDTQPPAMIGLEKEFIASARLDNLLSCFTGAVSLLACGNETNALLVCNDHEEVGSLSTAGAQGPLLMTVIKRLAGDEHQQAACVDGSLFISADNAHGVHPNFSDKHDGNHGPLMNGGPVIKHNASQRYATNSETSGFFRQLCLSEEVPVQAFVVRSDMGCGSTIGPVTAGSSGVRTLDVGVPTLAMHSIRELAGSKDAWYLYRVLTRFFSHKGALCAQQT